MMKREIHDVVMGCESGFQAKRLGRNKSVPHKIRHWHEGRRGIVRDVLISAAFTDAQFITCLLDPSIKEFQHVLPYGRTDPFWASPGENVHGKLLSEVRKLMITAASQLCHYIHNPYIVSGLDHIYLGPSLDIEAIPSVAGEVHLINYPPPPVPKKVASEPYCTDVRLRDNPALLDQWKSNPCHPVTPLLQLEISRPVTPEINIPQLEISRPVTPEINIPQSMSTVPSLLGMHLTKTNTHVKQIADTFASDSSDALLDMQVMPTNTQVKQLADTFASKSLRQKQHRKYTCPVCNSEVNQLKSHMVEVHLPFYINAEAACFLCEKNFGTSSNLSSHIEAQHSDKHGNVSPGATLADSYVIHKYIHFVASFLRNLVRKLELSSLTEILKVIRENLEVMPNSTWAPWLQWYYMKPTPTEHYLMSQFSCFIRHSLPDEITLMPPNCVAALIHWRPLLALMQLLPAESRHNLQSLTSLSNGRGESVVKIVTTVKPVLEAVDAHMHLDMFMEVTGHQNVHMDQLPAMTCCPTPRSELLFYVVNNSFLSADLQRWEKSQKVLQILKPN